MQGLLDVREVGAHRGWLPCMDGSGEEGGGGVLCSCLMDEVKSVPHRRNWGGGGQFRGESGGRRLSAGSEPLLDGLEREGGG